MSPHARRWPIALSALVAPALLAASGCDDPPVSPTRPAAPRGAALSTGTLSPLPARVSNRIKYRDAGLKPATGRSGSASLTVRALLGKDAETDLAITTGSLDDGTTPPGNLDKVQLKTLDPKGNLMTTVNYNKLQSGGFASYGVLNLVRGSGIQVQANVSGIDPLRSDVVTVTETVKLRPDLAVTGVDAPGHAVTDAPVNVSATVMERNGDVGAWAHCVLYVSGAEADRAPRIWVDASGIVSCAFTVAFDSPGPKQLTVALEGVAPGDWDTVNNSATASVEISDPVDQNDFVWSAYAKDVTFTFYQRQSWSRTFSSDASGATFGDSSTSEDYNRGSYQSAEMWGSMPEEAAFPLTRLEIRQESNGVPLLAVALDNVAADWIQDNSADDSDPSRTRIGCVSGGTFDAAIGWWFTSYYVCSSSSVVPTENGGDGTTRYGQTWFSESRWAGDVTYQSRWYQEMWYRDESGACVGDFGCYSFNFADERTITGGGPLPTLGSEYTHVLALSTGGTTYTARGVVPLQPRDHSYEFFYGSTREDPCNYWVFATERGRNCFLWLETETGVAGVAFGWPTVAASP